MLWTRLALDPLNGGGMPRQPIEVQWQIAADDRLTRVVRSGRAMASPEWGHSVHVEVSGLPPHRWYWYQFRVGDELSAVGRTRTFPLARSHVDRLRFAIASCQQYEQGYYTAYEHMGTEDLDLVMHLGDYIYEGAGTANRVRKHVGGELMTVDDYRNRYAQYRSDPALQAAHARVSVHRWSGTITRSTTTTPGFYQEAGAPVEQFALRRAAGYKAYYEHMPLRRRSIPRGALLQLYRPFTYGNLASIFMLDTRQYRTDQPCGDNVQLAVRRRARPEGDDSRRGSGEMADGRTRSLAEWMESAGSAGSCGAARQDAWSGTSLFHGQMGRVSKQASPACCSFSARGGHRTPSRLRAMFTTTG